MSSDKSVRVALLTQREVDRLGETLERSYPVTDEGMFDHLLAQLDGIEIEPLGKGYVFRRKVTLATKSAGETGNCTSRVLWSAFSS